MLELVTLFCELVLFSSVDADRVDLPRRCSTIDLAIYQDDGSNRGAFNADVDIQRSHTDAD